MALRWTTRSARVRPRPSAVASVALVLAGLAAGALPGAGQRAVAAAAAAPDPPGPSPLTGLPGAPPARPALVVKIDNAPRARPQVGLNSADLVVEELVEGGITRFAAVFHSQDSDPVGPVRSARSTDIGIASALHRPLFAYSGANRVFEEQVRNAPLVDVGAKAAPDRYYRERSRRAPYNLFSRTSALYQLAPADAVAPPALFAYRGAGEAPAGAGMAAVLRGGIRWAAEVEWEWDAAVNGWWRSQGGRRHVDGAGRGIAPANVVFQFVEYRDTGLRDTSGAVVPEAQVVGEGEAWVLTGGHLIPGRWSKASAETVTRYVDGAGADIRLAPGRTWVELAPPGTGSHTP
ncbi:MAG TPA: DUF3048 domain-containing protein [Acidimicrobiia bacterium]|nr:DUF3048 domain-containing protein [Acidimicrobiia bacterium]